MTMQKITFADCIRIQVNQTGLKQIWILSWGPYPAPQQTPKDIRIKGIDYVKKRLKTETVMLPTFSPFIRYPVHYNVKYTATWEGVENMPFAIKRKIWESFTIALFFSVSSNIPIAMTEKDIWPGKKKTGEEAFKLGIWENSHDLSEKGLCSFKSQVLLSPLSNIFYFTSPEKK